MDFGLSKLIGCVILQLLEGDEGEMEFAESVLLPAAEQFAMVTDSNHRDEDRLLHFFVGCDVSTGHSEIMYSKRIFNLRSGNRYRDTLSY
jgi:hypothetical protein